MTRKNSSNSSVKKSECGCCGCDSRVSSFNASNGSSDEKPPLRALLFRETRLFCFALGALLLWSLLYFNLERLSHLITYGLLFNEKTSISEALEFFFYDTAKIFLLLVLLIYVISFLRAGLNLEKVRVYLSGKGKGIGYFLAAIFGAITPFCTCSSIPLFLGFISAGIPFGMTMAFLITSPLINEIAIVLFWGLLGWKLTLIYVAVGLSVGILGGLFMDWIGARRWLQPFLSDAEALGETSRPAIAEQQPKLTIWDRHEFAFAETKDILRRVWIWILIGVAVGALLHGFVPQDWFARHLGVSDWWAVPLSVLAGIPLYTNVTGIVPVMSSLLSKGLPLGTTLAFCMSTVAVSLPELLMLKQVMQIKLLVLFAGTLLLIFTAIGWFFNFLQ